MVYTTFPRNFPTLLRGADLRLVQYPLFLVESWTMGERLDSTGDGTAYNYGALGPKYAVCGPIWEEALRGDGAYSLVWRTPSSSGQREAAKRVMWLGFISASQSDQLAVVAMCEGTPSEPLYDRDQGHVLLLFTPEEWDAFTGGVEDGEFDFFLDAR